MKKILLVLLALISIDGIAQDFTENELMMLEGNWKGNLTYTDYQDDKRQVTLPTRLEASTKKGKVVLKFIYTEPNGEEVSGSETLSLGKNGKINYGGSWTLSEYENGEGTWKVIMEKEGKDNNKEANLKTEITYSPERIILTKLVMYKEGGEFFQRNQYTLEKSE